MDPIDPQAARADGAKGESRLVVALWVGRLGADLLLRMPVRAPLRSVGTCQVLPTLRNLGYEEDSSRPRDEPRPGARGIRRRDLEPYGIARTALGPAPAGTAPDR